jgi:hypothetical protein
MLLYVLIPSPYGKKTIIWFCMYYIILWALILLKGGKKKTRNTTIHKLIEFGLQVHGSINFKQVRILSQYWGIQNLGEYTQKPILQHSLDVWVL